MNKDYGSRVQLTNIYGNELNTDSATRALIALNQEHHEIHEGEHYNYCDFQTGLSTNDEVVFIINTPALATSTKQGHLIFELWSKEGAQIWFYEGVSSVVGGTAITPKNNNRNFIDSSIMTIIKDPTSYAYPGADANNYVARFLAGANKTAGIVVRSKENVLAYDEWYAMRVIATANINEVSWCFEWYEHTPKTEV